MKKLLFFTFLLFGHLSTNAQAPVIEGDVLLCPQGNGTATVVNGEYDSYQWYVDFYPYDVFEPVAGATSASFTYDQYNYSVSKIKVVAVVGGSSYDSNILTIDGISFLPISYMTETEGDVEMIPGEGYMICNGGSVINTVNSPYTNVQWFKDGQPIEGANSQTYTITTPGTYYAVASPAQCPDFTQTTLEQVVTMCTQQDPSPVIEGDVLLCPYADGTADIVGDLNYDSYQWYANFYPYDGFEPVEGATGPSFTYDWYTYDQAYLKVEVTIDGETYESNIIQIDSYNWTPLFVATEMHDNVSIDPENGSLILCNGFSIENSINNPPFGANIQWFKDGIAIEGATESTYIITEAGSYNVEASPDFCPDNSSTLTDPIIVVMQECTAGISNPDSSTFSIYPNPAQNTLTVALSHISSAESYTIIDVTGKVIAAGTISSTSTAINVSALANGTYILKMTGPGTQASKLFIKE